MKTVWIDADSILYKACHLSSRDDTVNIETDDEAEDIALDCAVNEQLEDAIRIFHGMVKDIMRVMPEGSEPKLVITVKSSHESNLLPNFRYDLMARMLEKVNADPAVKSAPIKGYKHSREGKPVPDGLNELYNYVFDLDNTVCIGGVEADDVVTYYGNISEDNIVACLDKDIIHSLSKCYNYNSKEWCVSTPEEIREWFWTQVITGDSGDGIRGAYRVGAVGAKKILANINHMTDYEVWVEVLKTYYMKEQTLDEAVATARAVCMTQWSEDKGLVLWQPPKKGE